LPVQPTVQILLNGEKLKGKGLVDYTIFFEGEKLLLKIIFKNVLKKNGEVIEYNWGILNSTFINAMNNIFCKW
jgi:hypothetical protein